MRSRTHRAAAAPGAWCKVLQRHLTTLLAIKLAALLLLWGLFFSPAHRTPVQAEALARHLAVAPTPAAHD